MRKPTKRWAVETWTHDPTGTTLVVYYDKDGEEFWCPVGRETVVAKSQADCRKLAHEKALEILSVEERWERKLFVSPQARSNQTRYGGFRGEDSHDSPEVGFSMWRSWTMLGDNGHRYTRYWERAPKDPRRARNIEDQADVKRLWVPDKDSVELPYTDEAWEALLALSGAISVARERLEEIVRSDDFVPRLLQAEGLRLLATDPKQEG